MARSWEYSRTRRIVMQVTMWLIFGATLGLAAVVTHNRSARLRVPLDPKPVRLDDLLVQVPTGWTTATDKSGGQKLLAMSEPGGGRRLARVIVVSEEPFDPSQEVPSPETYLAQVAGNRPLRTRPFRFKSLGTGVYASAAAGEDDDDEAITDARRMLPGLFACVIVPPSRRTGAALAVTIQVYGLLSFGPSDEDLVQRVADGMVVASGSGSARGPGGPPDGVALAGPR